MQSYENLTNSQKQCVFFDKGTVLVSASAGSGKTHVIIERIIRLVSKLNVPVERILAMTFTNLAAGEMKEKLKKALIDEYNLTGNKKLKEEILKVSMADINTIHAFCSNLLRKYFYYLSLDANFEIIDEKKAEKLKTQALDGLFEKLYEEKDEDFFFLLSTYRKKRTDLALKNIIFKLENYTQRFSSVDDLEKITVKNFERLISINEKNKGKLEFEEIESSQTKIDKLVSAYEIAKKLFKILNKFIDNYNLIKLENSCVDFEDLQSLTIKLLEKEEVRRNVQNSYDYIFVDEYQDVNAKQEKLISLLSNNNCFEVGDSKQSIYAFRGCNPIYFNDKYAKYKNGDSDSLGINGKAISLNYNFRSAENIILAVNKVFSEIFTSDFCGLDYKENPMVYGNLYKDFKGVVNYHKIEDDLKTLKEPSVDNRGIYSVKDSEKFSKTKDKNYEHLVIAKLINDYVGKKFYYDIKEKDLTKRLKKYDYQDICILVRSLSSYTEELTACLMEYGIPVASSGKMSIGEYPEIKVLLNLLSLIKLSNQDIPLATIMVNLYDFTENELALIRGDRDKNLSFFACLKEVSNENSYLGQKTKRFLKTLEEIRVLSEFAPANEVLNKIIKETKWDVKLLSSENGRAKLKRVEKFIFESCTQNKNMKIREFHDYINKYIEKINVSEASGENVVKIMTAHASKGLEFPLVILTGLNKNFNSVDISGNILLSEEYGVAPKSFNSESMTVSENELRDNIRLEYKLKHSVEEARLLYVEFTRAKCELHLILGETELKEDRDLKRVYNAKNPIDFLSKNDAEIITHKKSELKNSSPTLKENVIVGKLKDTQLSNKIRENLNFSYPYLSDTNLPIKSSVSKSNEKSEYFETTSLFGESNSEIGTAYHRFLQLSKLDIENVESEKKEFLEKSLITKEQFLMLDDKKLKCILKMDIFAQFRNAKVLREQKFCKLVDSKFLNYENSNEKILVQGIIDCVLIKDNKATLIDYKYSTIKNDEDIVKAYKTQIALYKDAIESILKIKVEKSYIINILQEKIISVNV